MVRVPESEIVLKKAVEDYERYVRDVKEELYGAFVAKCGDHNESERPAIEVCEQFGLADVRQA